MDGQASQRRPIQKNQIVLQKVTVVALSGGVKVIPEPKTQSLLRMNRQLL